MQESFKLSQNPKFNRHHSSLKETPRVVATERSASWVRQVCHQTAEHQVWDTYDFQYLQLTWVVNQYEDLIENEIWGFSMQRIERTFTRLSSRLGMSDEDSRASTSSSSSTSSTQQQQQQDSTPSKKRESKASMSKTSKLLSTSAKRWSGCDLIPDRHWSDDPIWPLAGQQVYS